jgi:predicted nucleotidyltransferase
LALPYAITGSTATIFYGQPRFTNDIDVVVELPPAKIEPLVAAFPAPEYYVSMAAAKAAVAHRHRFNVIQITEGLKIDVYVAADSLFDKQRLERGREIAISSGRRVRFASPEDVILKKLQAYREGGSDKHLRDIDGVLRVQASIDREYIADWANQLGVLDQWQAAFNFKK